MNARNMKFQLVIDNDSGTYRPPQEHLAPFRDYLKKVFPGLDIKVMHCGGEEGKKFTKMKEEHVKRGRERGEVIGDPEDIVEGGDIVDSSSESSSHEEDEYLGRGGREKGG